jgi:hypothetical protein
VKLEVLIFMPCGIITRHGEDEMKKYIYLFAIINLLFLTPLPSVERLSFTIPLPSGERIEVRGEFPLNKGGLRGLLFPSIAEAYTYQDVENAYNKAKQDYPNDYIWIEEF